MENREIEILASPTEFFRNKIVSAVENQKVSLDEDLEFYLVNLLCDFVRVRSIEAESGNIDPLGTPLAFLFKRALESNQAEKVKLFKLLGDTSLYFSGFFQEYFNRKTYDIDYYVTLGSSAYVSLANALREKNGDEDQHTLRYELLAERFTTMVDIIAEVSELPGNERPRNILAVYERWLRCNSDRLRKQLESWGISPAYQPDRIRQ